MEACEMSTFAAPVLVSVTVCDCWCPTVTLPKFSLVGLSESWPRAVVPAVPFSGISMRLLEALLVRASMALKVPLLGGVNFTLKLVL